MMSAWVLLAMLTAQTADVGTTCNLLHKPGYYETNPVIRAAGGCKGAIAVVGGFDTALIYMVQHKIHTPWKRALVYGTVASVAGFAATGNARLIRAHQVAPQPTSYECGSLIGVACK